MKYIILLLLILIDAPAFADTYIPTEVKHLQMLRAKKIKEIDDIYTRELEKLKIKYVKRGDFETAKNIDSILLELASKDTIDDASFQPVKLTQLKPKYAKAGRGGPQINKGGKRMLIVDNKPCAEYIFAHADSLLRYDIPSGAKHFKAVGCSADGYNLSFRVNIDGKTVYECKSLRKSGKKEVNIKVRIPENSKEIELITDGLGDVSFDHSCWAYPEFT